MHDPLSLQEMLWTVILYLMIVIWCECALVFFAGQLASFRWIVDHVCCIQYVQLLVGYTVSCTMPGRLMHWQLCGRVLQFRGSRRPCEPSFTKGR